MPPPARPAAPCRGPAARRSAASAPGSPTASTTSDSEARRQRPVVQVPGAGQRHRELHDLRRLEAHDAEVEPALRALGDVADERNRDEQQHADRVQEGRERCAGRAAGSARRRRSRRSRAPTRAAWRRNTPRSSPAALNSTTSPAAHTAHSASSSGPSRCSASSSRPVNVKVRCARLEYPGPAISVLIPRSPAAGAGAVAASLLAGRRRAAAGRRRTPRARSGAAVPLPLLPFSTSTATAIFGASAGANATNSAWSRRRSATSVPCTSRSGRP